MKKTFLYAGAALLLSLSACDNKTSEGGESAPPQEQTTAEQEPANRPASSREEHIKLVKADEVTTFSNVPATLQTGLESVAKQYLTLKEALVASNAGQASSAASNLQKSLQGLESDKLDKEQQAFLQQRSQAMAEHLQQISGSNDVVQQREHFARLSKHTTELLSGFGAGKGTLYTQFCPMAFDNKGAYWLSDSKEIRNPYYPEQMLTCGRVSKEL